MILNIKGNMSLSSLQKTFGQEFPYIKLEFFSQPHGKGKANISKIDACWY
jgi:hypothetical protein